jgi:catechol 2,3-dioxygenase-like lactoylglutathione lyase family enzyme
VAAASAQAAPVRPPITSVSHLAVYTSDAAKSEYFYVHDLGGVKRDDPENPKGVRYYFNPIQFVEVLPLPAGPVSIERMDHAAFNTADAEGLRRYLKASGVAVPARVEKGSDGSKWFDVTDPEGTKIEFVQPPENPLPVAGGDAVSNHMFHVGFIIHNPELEDAFYKKVLGFRPYWWGGKNEGDRAWISQQLPDSTDWMEYMVVGKPDGKGIPPDMSQSTLGVFNHFAFGVDNMERIVTVLWNGGRVSQKSDGPKIGQDAKWQFNMYDPDGTRAEFMEFKPIGKPCCSPFTADGPTK